MFDTWNGKYPSKKSDIDLEKQCKKGDLDQEYLLEKIDLLYRDIK